MEITRHTTMISLSCISEKHRLGAYQTSPCSFRTVFVTSRRHLVAKPFFASEPHIRLHQSADSTIFVRSKTPVHDLANTLSRRRKPVPTPHRSFSRRRDLTRQEVETHHVHDDQATTRLAGQSLLHDIDIPPVCRWSCHLGNHCSASSGQPTLMPTFGYHPHPDSGAQPQVGLELIPTSTMQSVFAVRVFHEHCAYGEGFCGHLARLAVSSEP